MRQPEIGIHLVLLNLGGHQVQVVNRQAGLFGQARRQGEIRLAEGAPIRRIDDRQNPDAALTKENGHDNHAADLEGRVLMANDARVLERVFDKDALPALGSCSHKPLTHLEDLRFQDLLDELGTGRDLDPRTLRKGPVRREEPFHRNPADQVVLPLENAGTEGARTEDRRVHDPLKQLLPGDAFPDRLHHVVDKVEDDQLLLRQHLALFIEADNFPPGGPPEKPANPRTGDEAKAKNQQHRLCPYFSSIWFLRNEMTSWNFVLLEASISTRFSCACRTKRAFSTSESFPPSSTASSPSADSVSAT
jgi:hypothetical protein